MYDSNNNFETCAPGKPPSPGKVCRVTFDESWKPCLKEHRYNYNSDEGGPCIFLKLNKVSIK